MEEDHIRRELGAQLDAACSYIGQVSRQTKRVDSLKMVLSMKRDKARAGIQDCMQRIQRQLSDLNRHVEAELSEEVRLREALLRQTKKSLMDHIRDTATQCAKIEYLLEVGKEHELSTEGETVLREMTEMINMDLDQSVMGLTHLDFVPNEGEILSSPSDASILGYLQCSSISPAAVQLQLGDGNSPLMMHNDTVLAITTDQPDHEPIKRYLSVSLILPDKRVQNLNIEDPIDGVYTVLFTPRDVGEHSLHVRLYGTHVCGSPMHLYVNSRNHRPQPQTDTSDSEVPTQRVRICKNMLSAVSRHIGSNGPFQAARDPVTPSRDKSRSKRVFHDEVYREGHPNEQSGDEDFISRSRDRGMLSPLKKGTFESAQNSGSTSQQRQDSGSTSQQRQNSHPAGRSSSQPSRADLVTNWRSRGDGVATMPAVTSYKSYDGGAVGNQSSLNTYRPCGGNEEQGTKPSINLHSACADPQRSLLSSDKPTGEVGNHGLRPSAKPFIPLNSSEQGNKPAKSGGGRSGKKELSISSYIPPSVGVEENKTTFSVTASSHPPVSGQAGNHGSHSVHKHSISSYRPPAAAYERSVSSPATCTAPISDGQDWETELLQLGNSQPNPDKPPACGTERLQGQGVDSGRGSIDTNVGSQVPKPSMAESRLKEPEISRISNPTLNTASSALTTTSNTVNNSTKLLSSDPEKKDVVQKTKLDAKPGFSVKDSSNMAPDGLKSVSSLKTGRSPSPICTVTLHTKSQCEEEIWEFDDNNNEKVDSTKCAALITSDTTKAKCDVSQNGSGRTRNDVTTAVLENGKNWVISGKKPVVEPSSTTMLTSSMATESPSSAITTTAGTKPQLSFPEGTKPPKSFPTRTKSVPTVPTGTKSPTLLPAAATKSPPDLSTTTKSPPDLSTTTKSPPDLSTTTKSPTDLSTTTKSPTDLSTTTKSPPDLSTTTKSTPDLSTTTKSPPDLSTTTKSPLHVATATKSPTVGVSKEKTMSSGPSGLVKEEYMVPKIPSLFEEQKKQILQEVSNTLSKSGQRESGVKKSSGHDKKVDKVKHATADHGHTQGSSQMDLITQNLHENKGILKMHVKLQFGKYGSGVGETLKFPIGVTVSHHRDVVVCDNGNSLVKVFSWEGKHRFSIGDIAGQTFTRPSAVITTEKEIFVKDDRQIQAFDYKGKALRAFGRGVLTRPYGLAITEEGHLVTIDENRRNPRVVIFGQDGTVISENRFEPLVKDSAGRRAKCRFLTLHKNKLYVVDLGQSEVYVTDLKGNTLNVFGGYGDRAGLFREPSGISADMFGNIIIADSRNNRVQLFGADGCLKCVIKLDCDITRPSDIHLTNDGHLLVVNYITHTIKTFKVPC